MATGVSWGNPCELWTKQRSKFINLGAKWSLWTLSLCPSAFLPKTRLNSQHSCLQVRASPLGSLTPWLDDSPLAWRGQCRAVWETGSSWVLEGDVFRGGYLVAGWQGANADSFQIVLFLPDPTELLHITLHTGKRPEALEAWRSKTPDRFVRKREGALFV